MAQSRIGTTYKVIRSLLVALFIFGLGIGVGYGASRFVVPYQPGPEDKDSFALYWEVWGLVTEKFYGDLPEETSSTYGAIRGALATLNDPYTIFVEPQPRALERADLDGQFGGIGAFVFRDEAGRVILDPMVDSPAEMAGLQRGDVLLKIDETVLVPELSTDDIVLLIRGEVGTRVTLTLERGGTQPILLTIERAIIETPSVEWRLLEEDPDIGYIKIRLFSARTNKELQRVLIDLTEQGAEKYIVDLRDNGGGLLESAIDVSSQFLHDGVVLYEDRGTQEEEKVYSVRGGGQALDQPIVVLINAGTASASEIVAGAIRDQGRAQLIGERTFGKGSVQLVYDLSDSSSLHVTVAKWFTPGRQQIDGQGLTPDIEVPLTDEDRVTGRDSQFERAISVLQNGTE
jgi:carboxyl-terminal processing protease